MVKYELVGLAEFFMSMEPPAVTAQERQVQAKAGRPIFYEPARLRDARAKLLSHLAGHRPDEPFKGALQLVCRWCFSKGRHRDGEYRTSRPDTDNLQKLLKDCMTQAGFWKDDAQVVSELCEKIWAEKPGIYIRISRWED